MTDEALVEGQRVGRYVVLRDVEGGLHAIAAGAGPGSEGLQGFKENTAVYDLIRSQL